MAKRSAHLLDQIQDLQYQLDGKVQWIAYLVIYLPPYHINSVIHY